EPSLYNVKAIIIMDNDGRRLVAKYYQQPFPSIKEEKLFEKNLFSKTHRTNGEIIMLDFFTCVYRSSVDLYFYVIGSLQENELILVSVLNCLFDSLNHMLRKNVEKRTLVENLDAVFQTLDEICDNGIILESDPMVVAQRVSVRSEDLPLGEQTVASVLQSAKEQIKWSLLK
ncbi:hypothetical protein HELRODRAFT_64571, partial [Helobdella robusta]|uniref:Coatomer subunit zeta n=1 Tax=Helobdella robusta TaxID=6412 RepID=T1FXW6_HELRO